MHKTDINALRSMLSHETPTHMTALLARLPATIAEECKTPYKTSLPYYPHSLKAIFDRIHPSWFVLELSLLPARDRRFLASLFSHEKQKFLSKALHVSLPLYDFSDALIEFFLKDLFHKLFPQDPIPLPLYHVMDHPLLALAQGGEKIIEKLCHFLGMIDIGFEINTIIKSSLLQKLYSAFNDEEIAFIKSLSLKKDRLLLAPLRLNLWKGDAHSLRKLLFERGLCKLALALKKAPSDLVWYIIHALSKDLYPLIMEVLEGEMRLHHELLLDQILNTWRKICTSSPS